MLRRGRKEDFSRSFLKYTHEISSDNTVRVTTTSNIFTTILSKIKNDAINNEINNKIFSPLHFY